MSFENPTPAPEKESRFLTLQEIKEQLRTRLEKLTKQNSLREVRALTDAQGGVLLYEVAITGLNGNDMVCTYRRVDAQSLSTNIEVAYYAGIFQNDPNKDQCVGGDILSTYDESAGKWADHEEIQEALTTAPHQEAPIIIDGSAVEVKEGIKRLPFMPADSESTETPKEGLIERIRTPELTRLYEAFDEVEVLLGTVDVAAFIFKEIENLPGAMELRSKAKPFLEKIIYPELIRLNRSGALIDPLSHWNPEGDITEAEFDELNFRRKRLSNVIGILHKDPHTGKFTIRHTLNDIEPHK